MGDGRDIADIRQKLPFADFRGRLQHHDLARAYRHSDIFVFPLEYGIFFSKFPGAPRGTVVSLTEKIAPFVCSDGQRSVRQLVQVRIRAQRARL